MSEDARKRAPFVSVAVRVKPASPEDNIAIWAKAGAPGEPERRVCCHRGYLLEEYEFSRVFGPEDKNRELFRDLQGPALTASVFSGVNETLFAYGQTGSGKTHTIFGRDAEPGLLQLFVQEFFYQAEAHPGSTIHTCCYEVLGDSLTDLVNTDSLVACGALQREDVVFDELFIKTQKCRYQIVEVNCAETCLSLLQDARVNRTSGVSSCNASSSRSHAVVHIFVQNPAHSQGSSIGALTLVDLAGTEKEHDNPSEYGRKCARLLNTSLSSLNRLLRKLQTGSLDESERRQSVLNKCLWEYLRPGCGVALIFCVSPLLKHRTTTLSTLAMATDSKLIHSQRKSQFIQMPSPPPKPTVQLTPRASSTRTPVSSGWSPAPPLPAERTPRRTGQARGGEFCLSPTCRTVSPSGSPELTQACPDSDPRLSQRAHGHSARQEEKSPIVQDMDRQRFGRSPGPEPGLALECTKLRRQLSRSRARSQERVSRIARQREQLSAENVALQQECESLRALFIRQQQQQIAFWSGPFMDMLAPKDVSTRSRLFREADDEAPLANVPEPAAAALRPSGRQGGGRSSSAAACGSPKTAAHSTIEDALRSVQRERDYWRLVATDLQREREVQAPTMASTKTTSRRRVQESELSTSNSHHEAGSEPSRTPWSESSSEVSGRHSAIEV